MKAAKPYKQFTVDHTVFDLPLSVEAEYWLGFLITDGCVACPKGGNFLPKVSLELAAADKAHVQAFSNFLKSTYPLYYNKTVNAWKVQVASQELANSLANFGVVPRKTYIAQAPESLLTSRHFWRGVIDGDGSISAKHNSYELSGASLLLLEQFRVYVQSVTGNNPSITKNGQGCTRVASTSKKLLLHLYQPGDLALDRKMAIVDQIRISE